MSEEGRKLGLIDAIVASEELLKVSRQWALDIAAMHKPWIRSLHKTDKIGSLSEAREVLKIARQQAKKTAPNMPQHQVCLDVIEEGIIHGGYSGVLKVFFVSEFTEVVKLAYVILIPGLNLYVLAVYSSVFGWRSYFFFMCGVCFYCEFLILICIPLWPCFVSYRPFFIVFSNTWLTIFSYILANTEYVISGSQSFQGVSLVGHFQGSCSCLFRTTCSIKGKACIEGL